MPRLWQNCFNRQIRAQKPAYQYQRIFTLHLYFKDKDYGQL